MTPKERAMLWKEWEDYYLAVKTTKVGRLMAKQKEAFQVGDFGKVRAIAKWARDNAEILFSDVPKTPAFPDPYETLSKVSTYLSRKSELNSLRSLFADVLQDDDLI
jgi:hypothetical protein